MTEVEIRDRVRTALGEVEYPPGLTSSLAGHLDRTQLQGSPRLAALVAAVLALAVILSFGGPRLLQDYAAWTAAARVAPAVRPSATSATPAPTPTPLPAADLEAARLSAVADLVTRPDVEAEDSGYSVTLIGLYADPARIIAIFHFDSDPGTFPIGFGFADQVGPLNASGGAWRGAPGDYVYHLDTGPRPDADGLAQLSISLGSAKPLNGPSPGSGLRPAQGHWLFSARVRVQPSIQLPDPAPVVVGSWKVTFEIVEVTPSVIHIQALIDGAAPGDFRGPAFQLVDADGNALEVFSSSDAITVPKQQLGSGTPNQTRVYEQWVRPKTGGLYTLVISNGGSVQRIQIDVPAGFQVSKA